MKKGNSKVRPHPGPLPQERETRKHGELFPRGQRGVVCYRVDRMLRADRHVTKRALGEIAERSDGQDFNA